MTTNAATPTTAPAATAAPVTPPAPGTPEYAAAMAAVYDNQVPKTDAQTAAEQAAAAQAQPPQEQAAKTPESAPAVPPVEAPADETPVEAPAPLADLFKDPSVLVIQEDGKLSSTIRDALVKAGIPEGFIAQAEAGHVAILQAQEQELHAAAGGKESFDSLVSWGQKNLSEAERNYFDQQLNSPFRKEAVALLKQRAGAAVDPRLFTPSSTGQNGPVGFESQAQMVAAMRDPRYQIDPAYRAEVSRRLAVSDF